MIIRYADRLYCKLIRAAPDAHAGELYEQIEAYKGLPLEQARSYAAEIVLILEYLASQQVFSLASHMHALYGSVHAGGGCTLFVCSGAAATSACTIPGCDWSIMQESKRARLGLLICLLTA